jgi:murein DD-endopeptidase MepM/ murein hydrolase activator NlpD
VPPPRRIRLVVAVLGAAIFVSVPSGAAQSLYEQQDRLNEKIAGLRDQIVAARHKEGVLTGDIQAASAEISSLQGDIGALNTRIAELEQRLAVHRARLARLQDRFEEQTRELERLKREFATAQRILETRLVQLYQEGDVGSFEVLLQVQNLGDLIDQIEYFDSVGRQDQAISNQIRTLKTEMRIAREKTRATKREVAEATALLAEETAEQVAARAELVARQEALAAARASERTMLAGIRTDREAAEENLEEMQAASAALAEKIRAAQASSAAASSGSGVSASGFIWPVNGVVTSGFGVRWGSMHEGIDISAPCGTPIRAAASGTVIYAGWMDGYGNLTVVDHGNGLATAYAHQSAIYATGGVSQGQSIGAVGTTGHSTGCHLHFEVRVNGSAVDPMGYL